MQSMKINGLPSLKRFRLAQQQQQQEQSDRKQNPNPESYLPAKKRKDRRDSPPPASASSRSFCLPAKKRIWAPHPFDLNLECEPQPENASPETNAAADDNDDEDGIVCAVCASTDGDPADPIVLCDGCDLMVHATCYGHPFTAGGVPEGDWFCARCLESKNSAASMSRISCCLCPVGGGALKATTDGRWAHLTCAIYVPEVFFADPEAREGIDCGRVLKRRWESECYVCESRNGCVIDCSEQKCGLGFHVSCGLEEDLCIEYREGKNIVAAFCRAHTDLWKKQEQTGRFKIVARDDEKRK